ncbi:MAG: ATP-binding protein [Oscillospiraceae bacterium]|nr:ATP-binding protein [Oscillospiraceae bacterium]
MVSTLLLMNQGSGKDSPQLFIIIAILILIDIFVFYLYDILQQYYQERLEKNLLIQQNNAYLKQLNMISQSQENMRLLRHDIKNHISVLRAFIETDSRDAALQYLDRALEETIGNANEFAKSGNAEIDSIINYKLYAAKQLGIEADVKLKVPQRLNIQPFDLVVILGNLLENAIEASSQLSENKKIDLSVHFDRNLLYIRIFNFYTGALWREGGKLRTTHKDAENHGLGLESVQTSVDKYNGTMKISYTWQTFCVDILLYNPNGEYLADGP